MAVVKMIRLHQKGKSREDGAEREVRAVVGRGWDNPKQPLYVFCHFQGESWVLKGVTGGLWHFSLSVKEAKQSVMGQSKNPMSCEFTVALRELRRGPCVPSPP